MPYWLITTGPERQPGINGGLIPRRDPAQPCVNTMDVADIDASAPAVERNGGQVVVGDAVPDTGCVLQKQRPYLRHDTEGFEGTVSHPARD